MSVAAGRTRPGAPGRVRSDPVAGPPVLSCLGARFEPDVIEELGVSRAPTSIGASPLRTRRYLR